MPEVVLVKPRKPPGRPRLALEPKMFDRVIAVIKHNSKSTKAIIRVTGFSGPIVKKIISILIDNGTVRKIGSLKGTTYRVRNDKKANQKHSYSEEDLKESSECNTDSASKRNVF